MVYSLTEDYIVWNLAKVHPSDGIDCVFIQSQEMQAWKEL